MGIVHLARQKYNPLWTVEEERAWLDALAWCEAQEAAWRDSLPHPSTKEWLTICPEAVAMIPAKLEEIAQAKRLAIYNFGLAGLRLQKSDSESDDRAYALEMNRQELRATLADVDKQRSRWLSYQPPKDAPPGRLTQDDIEQALAVPLQTLADISPKQSGTKLLALCPFHHEKTPSFYLYLEQNSWWCYGCNQGGSVIDYVMRAHDFGFKDAVTWLLR